MHEPGKPVNFSKQRKNRIYLSPPHMSGKELECLMEAFESNWIAPLGPHVDRFEKEFTETLGGGHSCAVSSGTAALHLILRVLGIGPGDSVICSSFTFCASVNPILYQGAVPVLVDSDAVSWNMDPNLLEKELNDLDEAGMRPKAVIAVDLYGQSADLDVISEICTKREIPVVEDAAEALGAEYKGKPAGTSGFASVFSFNGNKIITTSGGGMVYSKDVGLVEKSRFFAQQARDQAPHYEHSEIGYNYRMSNLLAAVGEGQLKVLADRVRRKREIFEYYQRRLGPLQGISFMPEPDWSRASRWLTCIVIDPKKFGASREDIRLELERRNIESRPLWKPMHMQPAYKKYRHVGGSVSEVLFRDGLCLPSGTAMAEEDLDFICTSIEAVSGGA
jgi:dTDP-4-amino-4,6-dideoxygalactose transaminase